jgi:DHA1 family bicyclomycin/chloramphenicol resistance-like MFS transporter
MGDINLLPPDLIRGSREELVARDPRIIAVARPRKTTKNKNYMPLITITIIIIEILSGAEVDLFVPGFPEIQKTFDLSPFMVELMLGLNFCAYTISTLIIGNLGDKYGAKPIIITGLSCFIFGSLCCIYAQDYWQVLAGRVLQGIGIAGPSALAYVVIAELYDVQAQVKIMGWLNGTITLAMATAPIVGSYVNLFFGWRGNFALLLIVGSFSLLMALLVLPRSKSNKEVSFSLREYVPIFYSRNALLYITALCFLSAPYWVFIGISPILYMSSFGVTLTEFGYYQGVIAFVFAILSFSSSWLLGIFGRARCLKVSILICCLAIVFIGYLAYSDSKDPVVITSALGLLAAGVIFPTNILWPYALETVQGAKSRISAIMLAGKLLLSTFGLQIVSYYYDGTFFNVACIIVVGTSVALLAIWRLIRSNAISFGD